MLYSRGVVPVKRYMDKGLVVGLGTDFGGAPTAGMLNAVRGAVLADRTIQFEKIKRGQEVNYWPSDGRSNWDVGFVYGYYLATVHFV